MIILLIKWGFYKLRTNKNDCIVGLYLVFEFVCIYLVGVNLLVFWGSFRVWGYDIKNNICKMWYKYISWIWYRLYNRNRYFCWNVLNIILNWFLNIMFIVS